MAYLDIRKKIFLAVLVLLVLAISGSVYINGRNRTQVQQVVDASKVQATAAPIKNETPEPDTVTVYICGYVKKPGNITLPYGKRLGDALSLAGGSLPAADLTSVNLAHRLQDEEMVYIPKKGEEAKSAAINSQGARRPAKTAGSSRNSGELQQTDNGLININTASEAQLDKLPGVGLSTAEKIIGYRKSKGKFDNIEELKNVSGIGDKKFNDLKDKITVN